MRCSCYTHPSPVIEIAWDARDALPFALLLASGTGIAHGNVVLADHGRTIHGERIAPPDPTNPRYRSALQLAGLTFAAPIMPPNGPARSALELDPRAAVPALRLAEDGGGEPWQPRPDLLDADPFTREFVVEVEDDGRALLRFGDDLRGQRPSPERALLATYRVGGGRRGNVGPGALAHVVTEDAALSAVRNLLPAQGGTDPEPIEQVRLYAPAAFRTQERCVTAADYQALAERQPEVRRAAAELR